MMLLPSEWEWVLDLEARGGRLAGLGGLLALVPVSRI
jgi:hypothetical protein